MKNFTPQPGETSAASVTMDATFGYQSWRMGSAIPFAFVLIFFHRYPGL